ncbi:MAG: hypothetical protein WDM89_17010 [Rhizomicrobium sp.]
MGKTGLKNAALSGAAMLFVFAAHAADYSRMAPIDRYLMDRSAEIALAKSAAPASISGNATVLVLTRGGYETAIKGTNGFVCAVERSWMSQYEFPQFWNPHMRGLSATIRLLCALSCLTPSNARNWCSPGGPSLR